MWNFLFFSSDIPADKRSAELVSNDMYREMLRQKWEEEAEAAMNQPIHYSNVQYDGMTRNATLLYIATGKLFSY